MLKSEIDFDACPDFDYFDYEPILTWAKAVVKYSDTFVGGDGVSHQLPEFASWTLIWDRGFIGFDSISKKEDEPKARMASAMFIYLYCKGVKADIADNCAALYARHMKITRC
jgi:hypothetical protein